MFYQKHILIYFLLVCAFLLHASVSSGHEFDKDTVDLFGVGDTDTFTITDPTGCEALTRAVVADPSIALVAPESTGAVVTQTYTVLATGLGTTTITVNWIGIDFGTEGGECTEEGSHVINVIVHELIEDTTPTPTPSPTPISEATPTTPLTISNIDIHPIQVVQDPPGDTEEETTVLVAEKATMVRVFVTMDASDGTIIRNVRGVCRFADQEDEILANLHQVDGETLVIPIDQEERFNLTSTQRNLSTWTAKKGWESFNFFKADRGVHPEAGRQEILFELHRGTDVLIEEIEIERFSFTRFQDTDGNSSFDILYIFLETTGDFFTSGIPFTKNVPSGYEEDMSEYFEHVISVYPIPRRNARYAVEPVYPYRITSWSTSALWLLVASLNTSDREFYNRFVIIVPGREEGREEGLLEEEEGAAGFSPLTMPETVYVQSNASPFVLAHEFGHTYQLGTPSLDTGLGHNSEPANDGWDVREITGIGPKPEGVGYRALMFPEGNNNSDGWITFQEYNELLDQFVEGGSTGSSQSMRDSSERLFPKKKKSRDLLVVSGVIPFSGEHSLFPFFQSTGISNTDNSSGDDYSITILSKPGKELSRVDFNADFIELGSGGDIGSPFAFKMPFSKKAKKIEFRKNGRILESRKISKRRPSVSITNISQVDSTTYKVDINAFDRDKDTLNFLVSYTPDGEGFFTVDFEWIEEGKSFQFDISHLPGSDEGKIRVLVTDGVRSATAFSSAFKVPNQPPMVSIINPIGNAEFEKGSTIVLSGSVMDPEDGNLPEDSLTWQSDKDGTLGIGEIIEVSADNLSTGTHTIKFTAIDNGGTESSKSISIEVVETAKPDSVVQDIEFSPSTPAVGDDITISAFITNFGKDATGTVTFFDGDPDTGGTQISSSEIALSANSTTKASAIWVPSTTGNKSIFVRVSDLDPDEEVTDNNTMSETIEIFSGTSLSVSTDQLEFGDEETLLNFYIENVGGGTLDWSITESGNDQDAISVSVTSGTTPGKKKDFITVKLNRPGKDNETHNVTLKVSSDGGDSEIKLSYQDKR